MNGSIPRLICRQLYNGRASFRKYSSDHQGSSEINEPPIPEFVERTGESRDVLKARLVYQSRKRGITESGLLLSTFAAKHLNGFTDSQMKTYDVLINKPSNDWDIYYWATGARPTPPEYESDVMALLKEHACNDKREQRLRQPDLYS